MSTHLNRRKFLKAASMAGFSLSAATSGHRDHHEATYRGAQLAGLGKRVGIIGLDTSHSIEFTKALNDDAADSAYKGYKIVAAYPWGSKDIRSSTERIPAYTEEVKKRGVEIVGSIKALLEKTDVIMLETNDGRPHLQQALEVMKAGKRMFIDKPIAASLAEVIAIMEASKKYKVPVFSASSLRWLNGVQDIASGKTVGKVLGADAFSPADFEPHHPDFFWYGIHGIETLCTMMGEGCSEVVRVHTEGTDVVVGTWNDGRLGTFRGTRTGQHEYGGTAFGEKGNAPVGPYSGYGELLKQITGFFDSGVSPVSESAMLEIYAFMEAADESKRNDGKSVSLAATLEKARALFDKNIKRSL